MANMTSICRCRNLNRNSSEMLSIMYVLRIQRMIHAPTNIANQTSKTRDNCPIGGIKFEPKNFLYY